MLVEVKLEDNFHLYAPELESNDWFEVLTQMYQPIIGAGAASIYISTRMLINANPKQVTEISTENLLNKIGMTLSVFNKSIKFAEALKLIKVKVKKGTRKNTYTLTLLPPLSSDDFFKNDLLISMLREKIGNKCVNDLISRYLKPFVNQSKFEDVTSSFQDVFKKDDAIINNEAKNVDVGFNASFDISELKDILTLNSIDTSVLKDKELINVIKNSIILYDISILDIANVFINKNLKNANANNFRKYLNEYMLTKSTDNFVKITQVQPNSYVTKGGAGELDEIISRCEKTSPSKYLEFILGRMPNMEELNILENAMTTYNIMPGVMNVISDYIIIQKNNRNINPTYISKICASIAKEGILTVQQTIKYLMDMNKKEESSNKVEVKNSGVNKEQKTSAVEALRALEEL